MKGESSEGGRSASFILLRSGWPAALHGLRDAILAHPTMTEGLNGLFAQVPPASPN
jgi:hypothetical protein